MILNFKHGLLGIVILVASIAGSSRPENPGEKLARQYCSSCHAFPDPSILTKRSWEYLLTDMGFRLGVVDYQPISQIHPFALQQMTIREQILKEAKAIPDQPLINSEDWDQIRKYYQKASPAKSIPQNKKPRINQNLEQFTVTTPSFQPERAVFTLNRIDPVNGGIVLGNQRDETLTILDKQLKIVGRYPANEIMVDMEQFGDSIYFLSIGDLMGRLVGVGKGIMHRKYANKINFYQQDHLISNLHRPVDMQFADLDDDNSPEVIVSNFGDVTGNISVYDQDGKLKKILLEVPGAIRSQTHDFNADGKLDIAVLMGDARENISVFINKGQLEFERNVVVECHSAYGHTYFELQDFNNDGHMDFLVTNGDTDADPFNTLKNYHGVRIYLNNGLNKFPMAYFYPMYGAHFAKAADFDGDGDLDIAASAFFPDFASDKPEQFVYLQNMGELNFQPFTHSATYDGRFMTLDVGDIDLDGDPDIVLGGGYIPLGMQADHYEKYQNIVETGKSLLVFKNKLN